MGYAFHNLALKVTHCLSLHMLLVHRPTLVQFGKSCKRPGFQAERILGVVLEAGLLLASVSLPRGLVIGLPHRVVEKIK